MKGLTMPAIAAPAVSTAPGNRLLALGFVTLYGAGFVGARLGLPHAEPFAFLALRFALAAVLLAAIALAIGQAWLHQPDAAATLEQLAAFDFVRGVRQKPRANPAPGGAPGGMTDAAWLEGYARLEPLGLHYELQTPWWHLAEAARVAGRFPGTRIVINHAGMPSDRSDEGLRAWRAALAGMAAHANVAIKISGIGEAGGQWRLDANRRVVREVIELFGVGRCMFGSNYPVDSLCAPFQTIFDGFAACVADLGAQEQSQLFVDNARRIYRIEA